MTKLYTVLHGTTSTQIPLQRLIHHEATGEYCISIFIEKIN